VRELGFFSNHLFNPWIMSIRNILSAAVFVLLTMTGFAQTISPTVQPAQGGTFTGGNLQMQYTIGQPLNQTFTAGANEFSLGFNQPEQNLLVDSLAGSPYYAGDSITIYFSAAGIYGPGNIFTALLSDSNGSFASPFNLGTDTGKVSGNIKALLPFSILDGSQYQIKVVSSYPSFFGGHSNPLTIHNIGLPVGLSSEGACSDTAYNFKFNVMAGSGGNQIEWANDKSFSGSIILNSPDSIVLTVNANTTDTLWMRTRDSVDATHIYTSNLITYTETVDSLPIATVYPVDTMLNQGDTVILHAISGTGVTYFWPQFESDSSSTAIAFYGDSLIYYVDVTGPNGCVKEKNGRITAGGNGYMAPVIGIINPDSNIIYYTNTLSGITSCHDYLNLSTLVVYSDTGNYTVVQIIPVNLNLDTTTIGDSVHLTGSNVDTFFRDGHSGAGITYSWKTGTTFDTLTWNIPANYESDNNFKLIANLYTNCGSNISSTPSISTRLFIPSSHTAQLSYVNSPPTIYQAKINASISAYYENPGTLTYQSISICAASNNQGVYDFDIQPLHNTDTIKLKGGVDSLIFTGPFNLSNPLNVSESIIRELLGTAPLTTGTNGCITATVSHFAPDSCATDTETYYINIICNYGDTFNRKLIDTCSQQQQNGYIYVEDNGNNDSIQITPAFYENGIQDTSIDICSTPFAIRYKLFNPPIVSTHLPGSSNNKQLQYFTVFLDPDWINVSSLIVTYTPPAGSPVSLSYANGSGNISVDLVSNGYVIDNDSTAYIEFNSLRLNFTDSDIYGGGPNSCQPPNGNIVGQGTISYLSNCGSASSSPPSPYTASSISYGNTMGVVETDGGATLDGQNNDQVSPGDNPVLNFSWQQNPPNGNPWNFNPSSGTGPSFFQCPTVIYKATLILPPLLSLVTDSLIYKSGDSIQHLPLTGDTAGTWIAYLPGSGFGNNDTISVQVALGDCPTNDTGELISPRLALSATCEDGSCSATYCFESFTNTLSVHCPGYCGGTGIGTLAMSIKNLNAPGIQAAYACDVVDFKITGKGFSGAPAPAPDSTKSIFLVLTYPDSLGATDSIFTLRSATASASYRYLGVSDTVTTSLISLTHSSGTWTAKVAISDSMACRAIRANDDTFTIDLQLPVECDLKYYSPNQGIGNLNGINADMEFNAIGESDTVEHSCDAVTANFQILSHQYGTSVTFSALPPTANPCSQIMVIADSAIDGYVTGPEMPGYIRPLITWPTDGSLKVTYPIDMTIQSIVYGDSIGQTDTNYIYYTTASLSGTKLQTKIYGFRDTVPLQYYWPDYGKSGPEFLRKLIISFSQTGCGNEAVTDTLPHQKQDGKDSAICVASCDSWITFTKQINSLTNSSSVTLNQIPAISVSPLLTTSFTLPFVVSAAGLGSSPIYITPKITVPTTALVLPPTLSFVDSSFTIPVNNHSVTTYTRLHSDSLQIAVSINECVNQTINLPIGYSCSGQAPDTSTTFCGDNASTSITVTIKEPAITLSSDNSANYTFADCKGICCNDSLHWSIAITNATSGGPAYNPIFSLAASGAGYLDISKVIFTYTNFSTGLVTVIPSLLPTNSYNNLCSFNFSDTSFRLLGLPTDVNHNAYLAPGDILQVLVYVYGDGKNCASSETLLANLNCWDICKAVDSSYSASRIFYFNLNTCDSGACPGNTACQHIDPWLTCNPCAYTTPISLFDTIINPGCGVNNNTGQISLIAAGGQPNGINGLPDFTYDWSNHDTTGVIGHLTSGTYAVTVTNEGCSVTASYTLTNSGLRITSQVNGASCYNGNNGSISVAVGGGTPPFTYQWSGPQGSMDSTTSTITNLKAGLYVVTVSAASVGVGCVPSFVDSFRVTQPDTIFINFSITNVGCNDSAGSVTVTAITNATPYYSYRWSYGSDTTHVLANIGAGSYVVTITDANQCSASASATVSSADSISLQSVNLRVNNVCGGLTDSVEISATGLSASSYTIHYTLTYPDSLTSHDSATLHYNSGVYVFTIPTTLLDTPGLFKVTINSISFSSGCTGTLTTGISQTFWVYPSCATSLSLSPDSSVFCPGHTFILQSIPSGTTGIYSGTSYTWSINGIMDVDALHNIHPTFTAPSTGTYTYSVSCVTAYGCHGSDSTTIHVDSISAMVTPADPSVCVWGNSITLTAPLPPSGSGYSYHWSNSNTSRSITVTPTTSIGYTVIVSDSHCTDSMHVVVALDTFTVFVNPTDASSCAGGQVTFNASSSHPISSYLWSNASITNTATYTLSHTGSFTVTATDANGCHDTASVMATVDSPAVDISYILCNGGIATANVSHDAGGATYQWNTGGAADTISNFSAGTYSVTVTDQLYCTASDSVSIPQPHSHLLLNGVIHYSTCHNNDSILVEVSGGTAPYFYHWNIGSTTPNLINISPGTYSVTVTDSALCSGNATYIVLPPFPVTIISGTGTTLCTPGFDTLTASATGGVSPYTYLWSTGDTTQSSAIAYTDGLFTVTVTDASGCSNKDSITLNVFSNAITNENFYQCYTNDGFTANLFFYDPNDTTVKFEGTPPYTFHWSSGTVTNPTQVPGNPYEYNISISTPGTYVLSITDAAGCEIAREIEVYSQSHFHFSDSTSVLNCSTTIYLGVTGGVTGGSYNYSWSDGENGSGVSSITVYVPGTYIVTVTDATNCTASDSILVSPYESYACCFANTGATIIPLVTDTVWSDTLHISPGSSIYVGANVKLIVDSTLTLQSCEVVLGTNAQIIVEATDTLNLLGDILHGCDTMWNGIFVNFRGAINVDEYDSVYSIIEDAMSGVVVEGELDDSKAMFRHTKFNRNQTSISFVDYAPEANNICDVSDCYFGMGMYTSMLPAPARHTNYKRPVTGIAVVWGDLLDMTMPIPVVSLPNPVIGGGANTFQYVNCGVSAINCPLNLYANTFDSIRNFEGASGFNLWPFVLLTCAGQFFNEDIVIISELMLNNKFLRSNYI